MQLFGKNSASLKGFMRQSVLLVVCFKKTRQKANFIKIPGVVYYNSLTGGKRTMLTTSLGMLNRLNIQKCPEAWEDFVNLYGPLIYKWNVKFGLDRKSTRLNSSH